MVDGLDLLVINRRVWFGRIMAGSWAGVGHKPLGRHLVHTAPLYWYTGVLVHWYTGALVYCRRQVYIVHLFTGAQWCFVTLCIVATWCHLAEATTATLQQDLEQLPNIVPHPPTPAPHCPVS